MKTLSHWERSLTAIPKKIECKEMRLQGFYDFDPPIFFGPGYIDIKNSTTINFTMFATPADLAKAIQSLNDACENPYKAINQFRLFATDYQDNEWACGWTIPKFKGIPKGFLLTGKLESMITKVSKPWVSTDSSVELVFHPRIDLPMDKTMLTVTSIDGDVICRKGSAGQQTIHILDSEIKFFHEPDSESLWLTAKTSNKLPHPYLENWLSEPLRILLGQLIFPRLVARNFGDGTAHVSLRPSPGIFRNTGVASLIRGNIFGALEEFWDLYSKLLILISEARDKNGKPKFQSHQITRFYEEIIQATQGSRWVLCFTLASVGEGLAKMLMQPFEEESDFPREEIESLKNTVKDWHVNTRLRNRILGEIKRAGEKSISSYLKDLVDRSVLEKDNRISWLKIRHSVMHGNLVTPWSTEEEDKHILALGDLVHRLTREIIRKNAPPKDLLPPEGGEATLKSGRAILRGRVSVYRCGSGSQGRRFLRGILCLTRKRPFMTACPRNRMMISGLTKARKCRKTRRRLCGRWPRG